MRQPDAHYRFRLDHLTVLHAAAVFIRSNEMRMTFLGTSSGVPTPSRNVSSVALRLSNQRELWLFDCGEGTQHQIMRSSLRLSQLRRILVTHMHGDHLYGLMGLLASYGMAGHTRPIEVHGPPSIIDYVRECSAFSQAHFAFPFTIHEVEPGLLFENTAVRVHCRPLRHRVPAFGYRVEEVDQPGDFDADQAKALGILPGPVYAALKSGKVVTLDDGRTINGADLCGPTRAGQSVVYCTDTMFCDEAVELARGADLLIHEATYAAEDHGLAIRNQHSTATMAAQVALAAGVKQLVLTHFSPRYGLVPDLLREEAQAIFANTILAEDFMNLDIAMP